MNKKPLTVLLIEDSPAYAELVQQWLSSKDSAAFVLNWTDSLHAGLTRLARGGIDVILLDLGLPDSEGRKTFVAARSHAGGVPIVVLSANDDESLALEAIRDGAQDYIDKSSCNGELLAKAIHCAVLRHGQPASTARGESGEDRATVIGVMGAKGGVGATTVACNLAVELRRQTDQKTLLADLDVNGGLVSFMMNCAAEHSILDAASNIHRLDLSWDSIVSHGDNDLHIVRSPGLLGVDDPQAGKIGEVLTFVRSFYRWTVLDLGRLSVLSLSLLDRIDSLFLVTATTVPALFEAKRVMGGLRRADIDTERILLIVNQMANTQDFSQSELQQILGIAPYAKLPDASPEFRDLRTQGRLPSENGVFRGGIARLARRVAGLPEEDSRRGFSQFLSFGGKPRRAENTAPAGA